METKEKILADSRKIIEEVFNRLGWSVETVDYSFSEKRGHLFLIKNPEFEQFVSNREDIVRDLVYILKRLFEKNIFSTEAIPKCTIDINDRQSRSDDKIRLKAVNAAEEAKNLKTDITLEPMSSYERMVVHSALTGYPDISTESVGEGKDRRVKVKYLAI
jgi:spoIIIJ-associated protein